jgi:hypothetical protein
MNAKAPPFGYTLEQYYALLKASDGCYEYEDGEIDADGDSDARMGAFPIC